MLRPVGVAVAITVAPWIAFSADSAALADEDPVTVERSMYGWVETEVVDPGSPSAAEPAAQANDSGARPERTCTTSKSSTLGPIGSTDDVEWGGAPRPGPGGWLLRECSDGTIDMAWVSDNPDGTQAPQVTPEQLAQRATNRLALPLPEPQFEPRRQSSAGPAALVAIPTWFYLDGWEPITQRTSAGGVWAEVTAQPVATTWWPGDGNAPVRCSGPGRAWSATEATQAAPCRYTYRRSSAAQPGNVYPARVTVSWQVTWRGPGGLGGTLPVMERQSEFPVAVAERQTVIVTEGDHR